METASARSQPRFFIITYGLVLLVTVIVLLVDHYKCVNMPAWFALRKAFAVMMTLLTLLLVGAVLRYAYRERVYSYYAVFIGILFALSLLASALYVLTYVFRYENCTLVNIGQGERDLYTAALIYQIVSVVIGGTLTCLFSNKYSLWCVWS